MSTNHSYEKHILQGKQFVGTEFSLTRMRQNRNRRQSAYLNYNKGRHAKMVTPVLPVTFDAKIRSFEDNAPKCTLTVSFAGVNKNDSKYDPDVAYFHQQMTTIDRRVREHAAYKDTNYVGMDLSNYDQQQKLDIATEQYNPCVRSGRLNKYTNQPYPDTQTFKIYLTSEGIPNVDTYIKRAGKPRQPIDPKDAIGLLVQKSHVRLMFRFAPMWFKRSGRRNVFGLGCIVEAIEIFPLSYGVIETSQFESSKLSYGPDALNKYNSPTATVMFDNRRLVFQTPWCDVKGTGIEYFKDDKHKQYMRIILHPTKPSDSTEVKSFVSMLQAVEESLCTHATTRESWFRKVQTLSTIKDHFVPILRRVGDTKGEADLTDPPHIKIKLPQYLRNGTYEDFRAKFYDRDGNQLNYLDIHDAVQQGTPVRVIMRAGSIYVMDRNQFGLSFEAVRVDVDATLDDIHARHGMDIHKQSYADCVPDTADAASDAATAVASDAATAASAATAVTSDAASAPLTVPIKCTREPKYIDDDPEDNTDDFPPPPQLRRMVSTIVNSHGWIGDSGTAGLANGRGQSGRSGPV